MTQKKQTDFLVSEYSQKLNKLEIKHQLIEHPELKNAGEALTYLNLDPSDGVATLVMNGDGVFLAVVRRDDCQIDFKKIKEIFGFKSLRMATEDEFFKITGLPIGAARPATSRSNRSRSSAR